MQFPCLMKSVDTELIVAFTDRTTGYVVVPDNHHPRSGEWRCDWFECDDVYSWTPYKAESKLNLNWRPITELKGEPRKLFLFDSLTGTVLRCIHPTNIHMYSHTHFAEFDETAYNTPVETFSVTCGSVTRAKIEALLKESK